jgi:AcrR family transcriptional regulator
MPAPERTSIAEITAAARTLLESAGYDGLTMQAVAAQVGIRGPSLYKRVRNRDDLVRIVSEATIQDLADQLHAMPVTADPRKDLVAYARAQRTFAHTCPHAYRLIIGSGPVRIAPDPDLLAHALAPLFRIAADLAGPENALDAARTLTAWMTGFITMELAGAFNLGGDVDRAFAYGINHHAAALGITT